MASETEYPPSPPGQICRDVLAEAERAGLRGEIPVAAAVLRPDGNPEAMHWDRLSLEPNRTIDRKNPLAHAEFRAIEEARNRLNTEYLTDCVLVTTLEPCLLCTGALLLSRIAAIYFFTRSDKGIRLGDIIHLSQSNRRAGLTEGVSNHHPVIIQVPAFEEQARSLLENFFRERRAGRAKTNPEHGSRLTGEAHPIF